MITSPEINELAKALAAAQGQIEGAKKDSDNPFFHSTYADLASVWGACREALSVHGLAVIQSPSVELMGEPELYVIKSRSGEDRVQAKVATKVTVTTRLVHESGQWVEGAGSTVLPFGDPQAVGSAITYLRRYGLAAFVGVAPADDDGEASVGRGDAPKARQKAPDAPRSSNPAPVRQTVKPETHAELDAAEAIKTKQRQFFAVLHQLVKAGVYDEAIVADDATGKGMRRGLYRDLLKMPEAWVPEVEKMTEEDWQKLIDAIYLLRDDKVPQVRKV